MSDTGGVFSITSPKGLLRKLEREFDRLSKTNPESDEAQDEAINFFWTAESLPYYLAGTTGKTLTFYRDYSDSKIVSHIANQGKHFAVDRKRHNTVKETHLHSGAFQWGAFDPAAFDVSRLMIDLEDGKSVDVLEVAERVLKHWREVID